MRLTLIDQDRQILLAALHQAAETHAKSAKIAEGIVEHDPMLGRIAEQFRSQASRAIVLRELLEQADSIHLEEAR